MSMARFRKEKLTNGGSRSPRDYRFPFSLFPLSLHFSQASVTQPFPAATFLEGSVPATTGPARLLDTQPLGYPLLQAYPKRLCAGDRRIFRRKSHEGLKFLNSLVYKANTWQVPIEHLCLARLVT